ncbi:hypothetical protein [Duganella sp. Root1480D1]|uniref:hypothetical protein n=1 Tax=Duganella sp. Root1480D1 TaxID=1736471 RepID=UPI00070FF75C|nr:hypothetical protein [Duganella sp. Root1480D1]
MAFVMFALLVASGGANATDFVQTGLTLLKIRAVGDYQGTVYDNTIELWFSAPLNWPAGSSCASAAAPRVYIDAKNKQLVAAAYLALATGKKVDINVDDTLPIRAGSCEVSYLDISA